MLSIRLATGFKPVAAGWKAQTNTVGFGRLPNRRILVFKIGRK